MLKTEEIREICEKNQLDRKQVYEIRSEFEGMCQMSKEDEKKERQAQLAAAGAKEPRGKNKGKGDDDEDKGATLLGGQTQPVGISLKFFKKHCKFLAGC